MKALVWQAASLVEHPGHANQKVHGGGRISSARMVIGRLGGNLPYGGIQFKRGSKKGKAYIFSLSDNKQRMAFARHAGRIGAMMGKTRSANIKTWGGGEKRAEVRRR